MTMKELEFKAGPDHKVIRLGSIDVVREGDYVEWMGGAWTRVDVGSEFIGKETGAHVGYGFARIRDKDQEGVKALATNEDALCCAECGEPQHDTPSGLTCSNGHGGATSVEEG